MMISPASRCNVAVKQSNIHGFGVFAEQDIAPNQLIEACYALPVSHSFDDLTNYLFAHGNLFMLALGYGSIYNHSNHPNASYKFNEDSGLLEFTAIRRIQRGEEIYINYGENWFGSRQLPVKEPSFYFKCRRLLSNCHFVFRFALVVGLFVAVIQLTSG